jgi:hypothetical protein
LKFRGLKGWKLWTWVTASVAWSAFYLFFALLMAEMSVGGVNDGLMILFNWLFPPALLYLLLTVGKRR